MSTPILTCLPADWHPETGICDDPVWMEVSTGALPPLSIADGAAIGLAIIAVWVIGWGYRVAVRAATR